MTCGCLPLSCFGRIFQRRRQQEKLQISGPMEVAAAPRRAQLAIEMPPPSFGSLHSGTFGPSIRSPGLPMFAQDQSLTFPPPVYSGTIPTRRETSSPPPAISVTTPGHSKFTVVTGPTPQTSTFLTTDELRFSDEKPSREYPATPGVIDLDTTPRFHKIFKLLSPPPTKVTFTQAILEPPNKPKQANESLLNRVSRRLSRWGSIHGNKSYTHLPSQSLGGSGMSEKVAYEREAPPPIPKKYVQIPQPLPPPPPTGLEGCLTTRDNKPIVMVPSLKLEVPANRGDASVRHSEPTPIEASPVCDPWRHTTAEIEGLSDKHQAWML
ncbi:hypothetical protein TWF694_006797 [Orbilia ellipsospora]|uniref:Uncharacterized protein n=1 Tax=Orbilia ellipsospora TaxID=2528407 RepID=A0AAV9XLB5_9PEZI